MKKIEEKIPMIDSIIKELREEEENVKKNKKKERKNQTNIGKEKEKKRTVGKTETKGRKMVNVAVDNSIYQRKSRQMG